MTARHFIDNVADNTLRGAIAPAPPAREISIATGFLTPSGLADIADQLAQAGRVRLLLGAEGEAEASRTLRRAGDPPPQTFERARVARALKRLEAGLRRARDREDFSLESRQAMQRLAVLLRSDQVETRRDEAGFLPARAFLLEGEAPGLIAGTSNLSRAGLEAAPALNLAHWDVDVAGQGRAWFDALWDQAVPYDLAELFEAPHAEYPPWLIFLRMLWQLYGDDVTQEAEAQGGIPLTGFQRDGVWRAMRIMREFGGVLVADEVGLGKTFIGGAILEQAASARQRALLVCPATVRANWDRLLAEHNVGRFVQVASFDEVARDQRLADPRRPLATQQRLTWHPDEYALVVVDEAHNYRNPDAPYRALLLHALLRGQRKDLVLLTATPVNNSLWDLYFLMRFFLKQDSALAGHGIVDLRRAFRAAARQDPANLSPDELYPIIDAVTVKRTRGFVKRHYAGETIRGPDGVLRPVVFPKAVALTLRYSLDTLAPGLFDALADALDPVNGDRLLAFARYAPEAFRRDRDEDAPAAAENAAGLLRSGLLKRFESSAHAFRLSLQRMLREHETFLAALDQGRVVTTDFLRELGEDDDDAFEALLQAGTHSTDATDYDVTALRDAVRRDHDILRDLADRMAQVHDAADPKLDALVAALVEIAAAARHDAATSEEERRNRKVLVFSSYADTVAWLRQALAARIAADPRLACYQGRIVAVAGGGLAGEDFDRDEAVHGFAPESSGSLDGQADRFDLLIATDVLAEGVNLQQCRNIINADLPWNPMRLVQRHGRIDRIGSPHRRVFLRSVFPADRLEQLLTLETRILNKLTQASRSIGVATSPVAGADDGKQVFAETRAEIERLAAGDASLFDQGGSASAAQSGDEYRQRLRAALATQREAILTLPGHAGSGMTKGARNGAVFCAEVETAHGTRTFLRFVPAGAGWMPSGAIVRTLGTCLRLADCEPDTARAMPAALHDTIFGLWHAARADILDEWEALTDPANLQPRVPLLNRQVAAFIRANPPPAIDAAKFSRALDIVETPWPRREEAPLREAFRDQLGTKVERSARLVALILVSGLEPFVAAKPLPPIEAEHVRLVCWLALVASP